MSKKIIQVAILIFILASSANISARSSEAPKDSATNATKLKVLRKEKEKISAQIKVEDGKRNKQVPGVSYETIERMNDRQDSICLALRSRLVDVNLEIKNLTPAVVSPGIISQYNNLVNANKKNTKEEKNNKNQSTGKK